MILRLLLIIVAFLFVIPNGNAQTYCTNTGVLNGQTTICPSSPFPSVSPDLAPNPVIVSAFLAQGKLPGISFMYAPTTGPVQASGYAWEQSFGPNYIYCGAGFSNVTCSSSNQLSVAYAVSDNNQTATYFYVDEPTIEFQQTTSTAGWSVGASSIAVASCYVINPGYEVLDAQVVVGTVSTCTGTTLTLTAPALAAGLNGDPIATADMTACCDSSHQTSVPAIATGFNVIADHAHANYPWMHLGFSNPFSSTWWKALFDAAVVAGVPFHMDLVQREQYETVCCDVAWAAFHAAYPNVLRIDYVESIMTFCAFPSFDPLAGKDDVVKFWNATNYLPWGYPIEDTENLQFVQQYGASGLVKALVCGMSRSRDTAPSYSPLYPGSASLTRTIGETHSAYTISSCDYRVLSGPQSPTGVGLNTLAGVDYLPSGWSVTRDWTTRTCNGSFTIAMPSSSPPPGTSGAYVAPDGDCRNEVVDPIVGYVSGTTMTVVSGTFSQKIQKYTGILGSDGVNTIAGGTYVNSGPSAGGIGVYALNQAQPDVGSSASPASLTASLGLGSCFVQVRAHDNSPAGSQYPGSPGGVGWSTYYNFQGYF